MPANPSATLVGMADKTERPRMIFDCPEFLRRAIKLRAVRTGLGPSDVIVKILSDELVKEIEDALESLKETPEEKPQRGRPRKS